MDYPKMSDEELQATIYELKARQDISNLMADYWWYMDSKQWDKWGDIFTKDVQVILMGNDYGVESHEAWIKSNSEMLSSMITCHQGHQSHVWFTSPTTATGRYVLNDKLTNIETGEVVMHGYGYYIDDYEKGDDGKWRIKVLRLGYFRTENEGGVLSWTHKVEYDGLAVE